MGTESYGTVIGPRPGVPSRPKVPRTANPIRTARPAITAAVIGALWAVADALGALGPLSNTSFALLTATAVIATFIAVRRNQPRAKLPWMLVAIGFTFFLAGGIAREALDTLGNLTASRSSQISPSRAKSGPIRREPHWNGRS